MLNTTGVLTVLDRGLTLNWEDGPTLHRMTAQVRYHTASSAAVQLVRIHATNRQEDNPFVFMDADGAIQTEWAWREHAFMPPSSGNEDAAGAEEKACAWSAQLAVTNHSDEPIYLDTLDAIRIDSAYSGQFNLGAPPGLWRCARTHTQGKIAWEAWSTTTTNTGGFTRSTELLVQPTVSNRSYPPAVLIRAEAGSGHPTEIKLEVNGERFERLVARDRANGIALAPGDTLASVMFVIASGNDAGELRRLVL
ncbi:MAG: hypothetical protein M1546_07405 [Chloroflexi bacterium]|nr:hypothetical protein [Chloroflexota bacterium]